jgi:hypothetical protein
VKHEITDAAHGTGAVGSVQLIECLSVNGTGSMHLIVFVGKWHRISAADRVFVGKWHWVYAADRVSVGKWHWVCAADRVSFGK